MINLSHLVRNYIQAKMEAMDTQRALEAVERLQAKLKDRGEVPTEDKLSLLKTVLQSPLFHQILNMHQAQAPLTQVNKPMPKSVSLNAGVSTSMSLGMRGLSHSDSYTWAQNNSYAEFVSAGPDTDEEEWEGGGSSPPTKPVVPREKYGGSLCALNTQTESNATDSHVQGRTQLCKPPRISRTLSMGRNLSDISNEKRHIEMIELENDGKGLGFGIVGGRTSGIMVKTILPRGPAGLDKRLRSGDHILRIGDTDLAGMDNEEVALVLRNAGSSVKLLIARDVSVSMGNDLSPSVPLLPRLAQQQKRVARMGNQLCDVDEEREYSVQFSKNSMGLGFTVTGSSGQLHGGVRVKSIVKGSAVDQDNQIHIGDEILAVDGTSLRGCSEKRALEVLRKTGQIVRLRLARRASRMNEPLNAPPSSLELHNASGTPVGKPDKAEDTGLVARGEPGRQMSLREMSRRASMLSREQQLDTRKEGKLTDAEEDRLRNRWQAALGPRYQVVVCQLERFSETSSLGVSLEARAGHHYLCSVLPEGPVGQSHKIHTGDQILEVNGIPLVGESHREVVRILRMLPRSVVMVCCRITPPLLRHGDEDEDEEVTLSELLSEDMSQYDQPCCLLPGCNNVDCGSRGFKPVSPPLAMWERDGQVIELEKGEEGLGFSILDYQDPEDASKTVLVIRSLVPGGLADRDGRLLPGDRLVSVNDVDLVGSTLERAVNILKSSDYGTVRIGVAKPLPIESCVLESIPESLRSSRDEIHSLRDGNDSQYSAGMLMSSPQQEAYANSCSSEQGNRPHFYKDETSLRHRPSHNMQGNDKNLTSPSSFGSHFERTITVVRDNRSLGMTVSAIKDGSGMLIRSVVPGGCISQDGRLGVGDAILAINGESTSHLSNAQARAMLRRHSVIGPKIRSDDQCCYDVTFVPSSLVEEHRALMCLPPLSSIHVEGPSPSPAIHSPTPPSGGPSSSPLPPGTSVTAPNTSPASATRHLASSPAPSKPSSTRAPVSVSNKGPPRPPPPDKSSSSCPSFNPSLSYSYYPNPIHSVPAAPLDQSLIKHHLKERTGVSVDGGGTGDQEVERETEVGGGAEEEMLMLYPDSLTWGHPRRVQLWRPPGGSLGISIMGGRGMGSRLGGGEVMRGVFIKHVAPDSPAGRDGTFNTADRILEVDGVDLRDASHEEAVEAIRSAGDPVVFLVQSGQDRPQSSPVLSNQQRTSQLDSAMKVPESGLFLCPLPTNPFVPTPFKQAANKMARRSPTAVSAPITAGDTEDGSWKKMMARYSSLPGELHMIELEKSSASEVSSPVSLGPGLGLQLTGDKDGSRAHLGVYVAGIDPPLWAGMAGARTG
ncbi:hypothetical protein UPYG_G00048570 [Umbra pygmaea]|uniref:Multiple PDZ domain protein n=1 Tax=Umbra pygmaea TaxID=75934 RepID=A0ABD0XRH1_UMBPY